MLIKLFLILTNNFFHCDYAFETPKIYEIYSYLLYLLIVNKIMDIEDLKNIKELEAIEEDLKEINIVYRNIYNDIKNDEFKNRINGLDL